MSSKAERPSDGAWEIVNKLRSCAPGEFLDVKAAFLIDAEMEDVIELIREYKEGYAPGPNAAIVLEKWRTKGRGDEQSG